MTDSSSAPSPVLTSTSRPSLGAFVLVGALLLFTLVIGAVAATAVEGAQERRTALLVLAGVAVFDIVLMWWLHRHSTVTLTAGARGITLQTMQFVRTTIPWQEVESVAVGLRGPSLELGWRMYGGGRVAYAAGPETITVTTTRRRGHRPVALQGHRLAREYLISVSEAEAVAARLQAMRPR